MKRTTIRLEPVRITGSGSLIPSAEVNLTPFGWISEFVPKYWQGIAVAAVSGQLAMTLMKLFWYVAIFLLSLAAAIKSIPRVGNIAACPFRWMGSKVAEVAFDYTSGALGVIAGIGPAVFLEHHPLGLGQVGFMLLTMLLALFLMWFLTNLAASHFDQYVPKQIVIWLVALVFSCIVAYCFCYKEPWTETLNKCGTIAATPASAVHNPGR